MSEKSFVRIKKITMRNFRNIELGEVDFPSTSFDDFKGEVPSILGLYGQNGSGKTSLIMAINILQASLSGDDLDFGYNGCIREGCDHAELEYDFSFWNTDGYELSVNYSFHLTEEEREVTDKKGETVIKDFLFISNEKLYYGGTDPEGKMIRKKLLIDTTTGASKKGYAFGKDSMYESLIGKDKDTTNELREVKAVRFSESKSFVFSKPVHDAVINGAGHEIQKEIIVMLHVYGGMYLYVIDNHTTGINNLNVVLPLIIWSIDETGLTAMQTPVKMGKHEQASVPDPSYPAFCDAIDSFNQVLCKLIPGLELAVEDYGVSKNKYGKDMHFFSLCSVRRGVKIPLNCESDGIRRIISILSLLIGVFNQPSMTVVIDEIDSGIYEYLLGEILRIMGSSAKGQLIFTSHNLRALEVLPSKYICFTSTNPEKRFVKLVRSGNSNLRDQYFKKIVLGSEEEQLYDPTDNYEIELAFYNAGRIQDKTL